ncbi:MAG: hypothetical protein ACR2QE_03390, partial [Acidimicrobiales bacterium]
DEHLLGHLLIGLQLHFVARRGQLPEVLALCRFALAAALDQHYFVGTSHLFGVAAIGLARSGDARTAGRLLGAMTAHDHIPRRNAVSTVQEALGDEFEVVAESGAGLSVADAARIAIDALDRALAETRAATPSESNS